MLRKQDHTCKVPGDAGEVAAQELQQRLGARGGSQAFDELQIHRGWVVLHLLRSGHRAQMYYCLLRN